MDKHLGSKYEVDGISGVKDSFKQLSEKIKQKQTALPAQNSDKEDNPYSDCGGVSVACKKEKPYYGKFLNIILPTQN